MCGHTHMRPTSRIWNLLRLALYDWSKGMPVLASSEGNVTRLNTGGPPLGLIPEAVFETGDIALPPNSTLLLYTDGVTDRSNRRGEFYGVERLISHLNKAVPSRASDIAAYLLRASDAFAGSVPAADDLTLLVLRSAG